MKSTLTMMMTCALLMGTGLSTALAADHIDSPAATGDPAADLTDLFAWMSEDAQSLNLIAAVNPFVGDTGTFSDAVQYAFHVNSSEGYGMPQSETLVLCQFYDIDRIECWVGDDDYVVGDPSASAGVTSASGDVRVFAGMRDDPFYFESTGFNATVSTVVSVAGDLDFDNQGCPVVDEATSGVLVGQLQSGAEGAAASNSFAGANVLALVIQIDASLLTSGGPVLGVWASTHRAN